MRSLKPPGITGGTNLLGPIRSIQGPRPSSPGLNPLGGIRHLPVLPRLGGELEGGKGLGLGLSRTKSTLVFVESSCGWMGP